MTLIGRSGQTRHRGGEGFRGHGHATSIFLEELPEELADLLFRLVERLPALRRSAVHAAEPLALPLFTGLQVALALEPMQDRVHGPWAELVAVTAQLLDDAEPKDRGFVDRVVKDVQPDHAGVEVLVIHPSCVSLSVFDIC